jgi:hypothetical protein
LSLHDIRNLQDEKKSVTAVSMVVTTTDGALVAPNAGQPEKVNYS